MEFLPNKPTLTMLARHGIVPSAEGGLLRFEFDPEAAADPQFLHIGEASPDPRATRVARCAPARLAHALEEIIHKTHIAEWVMIPVGKWRGVFDLVAYPLAANEDWMSVDAEATLHHHTHDPLGFALGERHAAAALIGALIEHADAPEHGVTIASIDAPILIEFTPAHTLTVRCQGAGLCETLAHLVR